MIVLIKKILKKYAFLLFFLFVVVILLFPVLHAYVNTPDGKVFSGQATYFDQHDVNVYVSVINWSQYFGMDFENAYTIGNGRSVNFYPFYTLLGLIFSSINPFFLFQIMVIPTSLLLLYVIYRCSRIFLKKKYSLLACILFFLGGGYVVLGSDLSLSSNLNVWYLVFNGMFYLPHKSLAASFYFLSISLYYLGAENFEVKYIIYSSVFAILLFFIYPYEAATLFLLFFIWSVSKKEKWQPLKYFFLFTSIVTVPLIARSVRILSEPGYLSIVSFVKGGPSLHILIMFFGVFIPFVLASVFWRKKESSINFLILWVLVCLTLTYSRIGFSLYYLKGLFFPTVLLTIIGFIKLRSRKRRVGNLLLVFACAYILMGTFSIFSYRIKKAYKSSSWYYINLSAHEVFEYLKNETEAKTSVLAEFPLSNQIPAYTLNKVYYGHDYNTPKATEKKEMQERFFSGELTANEAKRFLTGNNIEYVVLDREDADSKFRDDTYMKEVYSNDEMLIMKLGE